MRTAFAAYAATHEPASIRRCWSTWNVLCDFLYTAELIPANPMPFVGRPKPAKTLPRALPQPAVAALLEAVDGNGGPARRTDWPERDVALILTGLLAGLRADELRRADVMSVISARPPAAVRSFGSAEKAARTVPFRSRPTYWRSSWITSTAGHAASLPQPNRRQGMAFRDGPGIPRCSLAAMVIGSPAAPSSRASGGPFDAPDQTLSRSPVPVASQKRCKSSDVDSAHLRS